MRVKSMERTRQAREKPRRPVSGRQTEQPERSAPGRAAERSHGYRYYSSGDPAGGLYPVPFEDAAGPGNKKKSKVNM